MEKPLLVWKVLSVKEWPVTALTLCTEAIQHRRSQAALRGRCLCKSGGLGKRLSHLLLGAAAAAAVRRTRLNGILTQRTEFCFLGCFFVCFESELSHFRAHLETTIPLNEKQGTALFKGCKHYCRPDTRLNAFLGGNQNHWPMTTGHKQQAVALAGGHGILVVGVRASPLTYSPLQLMLLIRLLLVSKGIARRKRQSSIMFINKTQKTNAAKSQALNKCLLMNEIMLHHLTTFWDGPSYLPDHE